MASYDKSKNVDYTLAVQAALKTLGADLGAAGVDGKWGAYTENAYQKNKAAVDALVSGVGAGGFSGSLTPAQVEVPEGKSFEQWLSIGDALYAAQYEAQKRSAQRQLEYAQQQVEDQRVQSAATLQNAANARGFGRSSYAMDVLQKNEVQAQKNNTALLNSFSDALMQLEANRASGAAQYASNMWNSQQNAILSAQKFNAQMKEQTDTALWKQYTSELEKAGTPAKKSGTSRKKEATTSVSKALMERAEAAVQKPARKKATAFSTKAGGLADY
mgnify:CR=1 FL=1